MVTRTCILILLFIAFAMKSQLASAEPQVSHQQVSLTGWVENNDGRLRLILSNNAPQEFRGSCRISLGADGDQKEIGQLSVTLPPQETVLLKVTNVTPSGQQYTLAVYDQQGARRFFKIAPLRQISDSTPAIAVTLAPIREPVKKTTSSPLASSVSSPSATVDDTEEIARLSSQVQVQARLFANEAANDSFILSFDLRAPRTIKDARLAIVAGKLKDNKQVSIYSQARVEFKLPDQLETERITYTLTGKDGRELAKGELDLQQLMTDGTVIVNDIRTDRSSYEPGESARIIILLEGKSQHGCRLEVSAKDGQGQIIFREQKAIGADDKTDSLEFSVTLPGSFSSPVIFEFKIFDSETGLLFDSGEREIPTSNKKP